MRIVCKTKFGSHKTNKEQEAGNKDDYELYSLHHFVKLACEGQTVAFDMLWTPAGQVERGESGHIWGQLHSLRHKFLSKRMNAFVGYARGQAAKYSLKGERLAKLEAFLGVLEGSDGAQDLAVVFEFLRGDDIRTNAQGVKEIQIAGKWFGETTHIHYVRASIEKTIAAYGVRTNTAARDGGVDWKAMSHAVRVSLELRELLTTHEIKFPLEKAELLLSIKLGKVQLDEVQTLLDLILFEIEDLTVKSDLPDTVDRVFWDNWLASVVEHTYFYAQHS